MRRHVRAISLLVLVLLIGQGVHDAIPHAHPWEDASVDRAVVNAAPAAAPAGQFTPLSTGPLPYGTESFSESFDDFVDPGQPPVPWQSNAKWNVITHSRDETNGGFHTWNFLEPMTTSRGNAIHHGDGCESPDYNSADPYHDGGSWPITPISGQTYGNMPYADANFLCRDHLMTALQAGGYGLLYQTPTRLLQIPSDGSEAVISLDVSTFRGSSRDWWDIWLTPWETNIVAPFDIGTVDLQGPGRNSFNIQLAQFSNKATFSRFRFNSIGNGVWSRIGTTSYEDKFISLGMACATKTPTCTNTPFGTSKSRRDTFELRISRTNMKFWMPDYNLVFHNEAHSSALDSDQYVVQFGHHSYNPHKAFSDFGERDDDGEEAHANTWHWDEFSMTPATGQFTNIPANERMVGSVQGTDTLTFSQAAPANSYFRGLITGADPVEYRVNGAGAWLTMTYQPSRINQTLLARNYFWPIPEGTTSLQFRTGTPSKWNVEAAAIWSTTLSEEVVPTPTPTNTPLVTATPTNTVAPTNTPTPTATATATNTPLPTNTPIPDLNIVEDNFDDNSLDGAKWTVGNLYGIATTGMVVAETGQELRITAADTSSTRASGIHSVQNFNLTGREAHVQVKQVATQAGGNNGMQTSMILGPDASNWFRMVVDNGQIFCTTNTASSEVIRYQASYSSTTHAWWRIRELDGEFYCDTSADDNGAPSAWTNRARFTRPAWSLTGIGVELHVLTYVTVSSATAARFDNFNTVGTGRGRPRRGNLTGVE